MEGKVKDLRCEICSYADHRANHETSGIKRVVVLGEFTERELEKSYVCSRTGKPCVGRETNKLRGKDGRFRLSLDVDVQKRCPAYELWGQVKQNP